MPSARVKAISWAAVAAGFADVVAGNRDRVPIGDVFFAVGENVRDDPHRVVGRVDIGAARHVFLEQIVLDRTPDLVQAHALLFGHGDIKRQQNRGCGVDGHGRGDLVQRDAVQQGFHVVQRADGHADLAHLAIMFACGLAIAVKRLRIRRKASAAKSLVS